MVFSWAAAFIDMARSRWSRFLNSAVVLAALFALIRLSMWLIYLKNPVHSFPLAALLAYLSTYRLDY